LMTPHTILFRSTVLWNEASSFCCVWLRVTHVRNSVLFNDRYSTYEAESHSYAYATPRLYPNSHWKLQKVCTEDEFGFTEGFDAYCSSHMLKYNAIPPTGGWQKG